MKNEVKSAVDFFSKILRTSNLITKEQLEIFSITLQRLLRNKYENHWFPDKPCKGSGFRCIRINHNMDPLVREAALCSGLGETALTTLLPRELTLWVDPSDVSYRIGENGSIGVLYDQSHSLDNHQNNQNEVDNKNFQSCKEQMISRVANNVNRTIQELAPFVYSSS